MRELERDPPTTDDAHPGAAIASLAIVGPGRVGSALAAAADAAGIEVSLTGRGETSPAAEALLICVPDASIAGVAKELASGDAMPPYAGHTSGATPLAALAPLAARGSATFSLHPLQTVPDPGVDLAGVPCATTGDGPAAERFAAGLARRLGLEPFALPEDARAAYHAAASIASNFLVALEESAAGLLDAIGLDDPRELLAPLVLSTAANWAEHGAGALTGPIARGDEATVARHLDALREKAPQLLPLYEALAERTRAVAAATAAAGGRR